MKSSNIFFFQKNDIIRKSSKIEIKKLPIRIRKFMTGRKKGSLFTLT